MESDFYFVAKACGKIVLSKNLRYTLLSPNS
jgi:hypothetical protein